MNAKFPLPKSKSANGTGVAAGLFFVSWHAVAASDEGEVTGILLWLYDLPEWALFALLIGAFAGLSLLGLMAYRRWRARFRRAAPVKPARKASYYAAATGVILGVLVGVLVMQYREVYLAKVITALPPTAAGRVEPPKVRGEDLTPEMLADLLDKNPAEALRLTLPEHARAVLPPATQDVIEGEREMEGTLRILHVDYPDHSQSHYVYRLDTDAGEQASLHFAKHLPGLLTGDRVRAKGLFFRDIKARDTGKTDGAMAVEDGDTNVQILEAGGTTTTTTTTNTPVVANTFGEQKTAVLLVNFQVSPYNTTPWTVDQARNHVFGPVSDFFRENSFNQTWLAGDVFGWFTIPVDPVGCPATDISIAANNAAAAQGVNLSTYGRVIYAFPDIGCSWTGQGTVGGNPSETWLDGTLLTAGVVSHEVGHNFGLFHSHSKNCGVDVNAGSCTISEYGDVLDRMGSTGAGHFNAYQKSRLGWLDYGVSPPVETANASGVYTLEPYAAQANGTKALRVLQSENSTTGQRTWYYLEFRQAVGFDGFLATSRYGPSVLNGVVFRVVTDGDPNSSSLLDLTPQSQTFDWDDLALAAGLDYTDPASGTTVTVDQVGASGAVISVALSGGQATACVHNNPAVSLSPSAGPTVGPGALVSFTVTATNNDSAACASAPFDLAGTLPAGWTSSLGSSALTLAPGASGATTLAVTSSATAAGGSYNIAVSAVERGNTAFSGSGTATYVVAASNRSPAAVADSSATNQGTAVSITVVGNDSDPDGDPLAVAAATKPPNGSVAIGSGGVLTYTPTGTFAGTDTFSYTISDGRGGTASATVTVTVKKISTRRK